MSTLVAPDLVAEFVRDGFVVVPDLLTDDELERYGAAVDAAVRARQRDDTRPLEQKSRYEQSFQQCINLWEDNPAVRPLTFHPRIGRVAAELLGVDAVRLWHDQALYKEAGGRETDPHQDHPYWPIVEHDQVTAWIPFDGSSRDGGAMAYVPGSHRVGLDRFVDIFGVFGPEPEDILAHPDVASTEPVLVEVPRGGVAFHHGLTVHLARPNATDRIRRVHTIIYFADGCTRSSPFPHPSVERDGIEIGAPIAGAVTPVVWPRADGDLPAPPGVD
jgi:ectoine hydroxylase-related dioxygenase (phytanoyl-CoA dioxygenase family)